MKLQSLCGNSFGMLAKPYHVRVNWPTTLCKNKYEVHFFTLNFECHNRYNKLLLCNSENGDIAWCNTNNSEFFSVFLKTRTKSCFFRKKRFFFQKKTKKRVFLNPGAVGQQTAVLFTWPGQLDRLWWLKFLSQVSVVSEAYSVISLYCGSL